jgi:hypothetical protein
MTRAALAAFCTAFLGAASVAHATGELTCSNGEGVSVDLLVGHLDVLSVARATVDIGDKSWSTQPEIMPGEPITVGQAFEDDNQLLLDLMDKDMAVVLGRLRVFKAAEGDTNVTGGVFSFKGVGAFVVDCSEDQ